MTYFHSLLAPVLEKTVKRPEKVEFEEVTPNPYFCVKTKHLRPDGGKGPV